MLESASAGPVSPGAKVSLKRCRVAPPAPAIPRFRTLARILVASLLAAVAAACGPGPATSSDTRLPEEIITQEDGRVPVEQLLAAFRRLQERGWHLDAIIQSQPAGTSAALPIIALHSPRPGPAVWILSGIHGEEPAGPNALAAAIDELAALGERIPVVLVPLCNPQGYARGWRYLDMPTYSDAEEGQSVGDSSHLLPDPAQPDRPRAAAPSSPEAEALTRYVLETAASYPPRTSIDLHEDDQIDAGYVYSQGELGADDELAREAVAVLREHAIAIQLAGKTRFGEEIVGGIVGPVTDGSIDELMGARLVLVDGHARPGPAARTVLVFETPARGLGLDRRIAAHLALLRRLPRLVAPLETPGS